MAADFWKPVSRLEFADLEDLKGTGAREKTFLDYKEFDPKNLPLARERLALTLAAFANSGGGRLVFGAVEEDERIVRFEGAAKDKRRAIGASIRNAAHSVQPPVDIEVVDVEIPGDGTVLFIVEVRPGQRGPFQYDGRYVQRAGDGNAPMPHTSVVNAIYSAQRVFDERQGAIRLDVPSMSVDPSEEWNFGVMLSPSYDTGLQIYEPFRAETAAVHGWLSSCGYSVLRQVRRIKGTKAATTLELWSRGHVKVVTTLNIKNVLSAVPVGFLVSMCSQAIRDAAGCLKLVAPMLHVDVSIQLWTMNGREPVMLEWADEHGHAVKLGLERGIVPIEDRLHRVADLLDGSNAASPETAAIAGRAGEYIKLMVGGQDIVFVRI